MTEVIVEQPRLHRVCKEIVNRKIPRIFKSFKCVTLLSCYGPVVIDKLIQRELRADAPDAEFKELISHTNICPLEGQDVINS